MIISHLQRNKKQERLLFNHQIFSRLGGMRKKKLGSI
jgi:hypothetical protein